VRGRNRPRVYWCPVGSFTFLPLHAAGIYTGVGQICVSDFVVSSYIPSLSALIKAREGYVPLSRNKLNALLISEPAAFGLPPLRKVEDEVRVIATYMEAAEVVYNVIKNSTVQDVIEQLPNAHILHMACHGIQRDKPLDSHFALYDGPLSISTLTKMNLPNAILAFLSACETARGDQNQPDQAIHLAASMLFCGFRSIIGAMW
jgi:CHAT domain-containing protein